MIILPSFFVQAGAVGVPAPSRHRDAFCEFFGDLRRQFWCAYNPGAKRSRYHDPDPATAREFRQAFVPPMRAGTIEEFQVAMRDALVVPELVRDVRNYVPTLY